jgi:hypothetical protein
LFQGALPAGPLQLPLNRNPFPARGIYFVRLEADGEFATREIIVE